MSQPETTHEPSLNEARRKTENKKRILISTIGSRGDVQPVLALASELQTLGHTPVLCVPPNFKSWVNSFDIECISLGPDVQKRPQSSPGKQRRKPSRSQIKQLLQASVNEQFAVISNAARECDLIVVGGVLQHAARSISQFLQIPYIHATYCPVTLKSPDHPPATLASVNRSQNLPEWVNRLLWISIDREWNGIYRGVLNEQRGKLGLKPVRDVQGYITTEQPWLAADAALAPTPETKNMDVVHTGAWFLKDKRSLPNELEEFLLAGEPPVYFGFGSMRARSRTSSIMIEAARLLGLRAIISQGWADLGVIDTGVDCITIGDVSHEQLLPRVSCAVHHGGAGTTTAAARAGVPQVVVPKIYDQYYWASRVQKLGAGFSAGRNAQLTVDKLVKALRNCMDGDVVAQAKQLANQIELNGARFAAERIIKQFD